MVEHLGRGFPALRRQELERVVEVVAHDLLGAAERLECRHAEQPGARGPLGLPEPLHDEREVRRLDPPAGRASVHRAATGAAEIHLARSHLVENRFDKFGLDADGGLGSHAVVLLERAFDRLAGGAPVEVLEAKRVRVQARDPRLERIERGKRVLA